MTRGCDVVVVGLGALGSATAWQLARRGIDVVGLERFELGHARGASHDTSRILRRSYHTPGYVRLAGEAYDDWAGLEQEAGERLVTRTGGVDLFPPDAAIRADDYLTSMAALDVPYEELSARDVEARWPALRPPEGTLAVHQADTSIVPAARGTATMARLARRHGARLLERSPVLAVRDGPGGVEVETAAETYTCRRVVVTADAWTNDVIAGLGVRLPLTVLCEQVSYLAPDRPLDLAPGRFPVWIWMDDPSFYGFPTYGEPTVKAGQDCGGEVVDPDLRSFDADPAHEQRLLDFLAGLVPAAGRRIVRSIRCLYALTPDRDLVLGPLPGHPGVLVGLGAAHGFKFAPTFGRVLADLATTGTTRTDVSPFGLDRPALTEADHPLSWLV